jgi:capsular exopolysaccharide synthesis family protein
VSKFFRALENAEKERAVAAAGPAADDTAITMVIDAPAKQSNGSAAVVAPPVAPGARVLEPPRTEPHHPAETRGPGPTPADQGGMYGARVSRDSVGSRAHQRVFAGELEPAPVGESRAVDDHLVSLLEPTSFAAEQYRAVRLAIETYRREHGLQIVGVSSPGRGEGKTMTAINVAGALAQAPDARVALVDVDLRHPRMADYLGLPPGRGLSSHLLDPSLSIDAIVQVPTAMAVSVVVGGPLSSMPYELLKSPRLIALFAALRERYDFVVVDTPPILLFPDVGILRDLVDGFIMVVRANRTPREGVTDGLDAIGRHRVMGLVFNDDDRNPLTMGSGEPNGHWRKYLTRPIGRAS